MGLDVANTVEMIIKKEDANIEFLHGYVYGALSAHGDQLHVRAAPNLVRWDGNMKLKCIELCTGTRPCGHFSRQRT